MLTKKDLEQIDVLLQKRIKGAFQDFFEHIFEPYVNKNENEHSQMIQEIRVVKKDISGLKEDMGEVKEFIKDHEKRIIHLEQVTVIKN